MINWTHKLISYAPQDGDNPDILSFLIEKKYVGTLPHIILSNIIELYDDGKNHIDCYHDGQFISISRGLGHISIFVDDWMINE